MRPIEMRKGGCSSHEVFMNVLNLHLQSNGHDVVAVVFLQAFFTC